MRATSALTVATLAGSALLAGTALALPQGGNVVEGEATITYGENAVTISQNSANVIIEWQTFDTAANETVHFDQAEFMAALNRILSGQATRFDGALSGAGSITIVNQAGIAFGATANVDVGAITATTLDIINANFMADNLVFDQYDPDFADASVTNDGRITVADQGLAALVGPGVANNGIIQARTGAVVLASGTAATIDFYGDGLVNFDVTGATEAAPVDADGNPLGALVSNSGAIYADGGTVVLAAEAVGGIVDHAINMDGVIQARSIQGSNGQIALVAGDGAGDVQVAGTLDASAPDASVSGGTVHVLGDQVALNAGADVDVSGAAGGGTALIGGAAHGAALAPVDAIASLDAGNYGKTSDVTYFDAEAAVDASASDGDGGTVIVWGTDAVNFHGTINTLGGAGGFVEVSTKGPGTIDGTAATMNLLVDPGDVCVTTGGSTQFCSPVALAMSDASILASLNLGGSVTLNTDASGAAGTGRVDFGGGFDFIVNNNTASMGTFTIHAADTIHTQQTGFQSIGTTGVNYEWYAGTVGTSYAVATADIIQGDHALNTGGGHVIFDAADQILINDPLTTAGGNVTLTAHGGSGISAITFGAFGSTSDDTIDTTDGAGNAGKVTLSADNLTIFASANPLINANGTGGIVTIQPFTNGRAINLGTGTLGASLSILDSEVDRIAAEVLRIGNSTSGNITVSAPISPARTSTLSLITGGTIVDNNFPDPDVTVANLALRTGNGIPNDLETSISKLAFSNTGGAFRIANRGNLTIGAVDGIATSSNTGAATALGTAIRTTGGALTLATNVSSIAATSLSAPTITVNSGVTVDVTGGSLGFFGGTTNLDGNLTASGGILGTMKVINVVSDTGGAEVQDAVDIALSHADPINNVRINIAAGTYAGFVVPGLKRNLTISGAGNDGGSITTIKTGSPAIVIAANGTTVQNMLLTHGPGTPGPTDYGIFINGDPTYQSDPLDPRTLGKADLTGIEIINVDFVNLRIGVSTYGDIGDGDPTTTDVTIRGNSSADRAIIEDMTRRGIVVSDDPDNDAVYLIKDLVFRDGADGDDLSTFTDGIAVRNVGAATIQGVDMFNLAGSVGVRVDGYPLTNANILIGGPDPADSNNIRGATAGIRAGELSGGTFTVQGNNVIYSNGDAIDFFKTVSGGATVNVIDNQYIIGAEGNAVGFAEISDATVTVARTRSIVSYSNDALQFSGPIGGKAALSIADNAYIYGGDQAIDLQMTIGGNAVVSIDRNGTAAQDGATYDGAAIVDLAGFIPVSTVNGQNGSIMFNAIGGNAGVTVSRNMIITGEGAGITFAGTIASETPTRVHNNFILDNDGHGISFADTIVSPVEVFQNYIAFNAGNAVNVGRGDIGDGLLTVQQNFMPGYGFGNGGFGYSQLGTGTPNLEGNWWGTGLAAAVPSTINGAATPSQFLATGLDTNIEAALGQTDFDPFAFQGGVLPAADVAGPSFLADALLFDIPPQTNPEEAPGDRPAGRSGGDSGNVYDSVFANPYNYLADTDLGTLAPAAGGGGCQLLPTPGGLALRCGSGGGGTAAAGEGGLPNLAPAAGGPGLDPGVDLLDILNVWIEIFGTPLDSPVAALPDTSGDAA